MNRIFLSLVLLSAFHALLAQETPNDEYYELRELPWNADWLSERNDVLVSGELYNQYPGPLAKYFYFLGQDPQHDSIQFELQNNVKREAPFWYGSCNGWAAAAILMPEPSPVVREGIKFNAADLKALLTMIWKDNVEIHVAGETGTGMSPQDFERVLYDYIATDRPLIFDVSLGQESWNFPVGAFRRKTVDDGVYVNIEVEVFYVATLQMSQVDAYYGTDVSFFPLTYTYRYRKGTEDYEWTGGSETERPQRAWYATLPYLEGVWMRRSNRFVNMNDFQKLETVEGDFNFGIYDDRFEPNDVVRNAAKAESNLVLAALPQYDVDYFRYEIHQNQDFALDFKVYSGASVTLSFFNEDGEVIKTVSDVKSYRYLPEGFVGKLSVKVERADTSSGQNLNTDHGTIFYWLQQQRDRSWMKMPGTRNAQTRQVLRIINESDVENPLVAGGVVKNLGVLGSSSLTPATAEAIFETSGHSSWVYEKEGPSGHYLRNIESQPGHSGYQMPHLTFVNGWNTLLEYCALYPEDAVSIEVFGQDGSLVQKKTLVQASGSDVVDLGQVLKANAKTSGLWFRLETTARNVLYGSVRFVNENGAEFELDLDLPVVNGENTFTSLHGSGDGSDFLSIVNTSGQENEVLFRLFDALGRKKAQGGFFLAPGEKWLGSVSGFVNTTIAKGDYLSIFSQFNLSAFRLDVDPLQNLMTALPPLSKPVNLISEATLGKAQLGELSSKLVVANVFSYFNRVLLKGYDDDGALVFSQSVSGSRSIAPQEVLAVSISDVLARTELPADALAQAKYFKLFTQNPVFIYELERDSGSNCQRFVRVHPLRERP